MTGAVRALGAALAVVLVGAVVTLLVGLDDDGPDDAATPDGQGAPPATSDPTRQLPPPDQATLDAALLTVDDLPTGYRTPPLPELAPLPDELSALCPPLAELLEGLPAPQLEAQSYFTADDGRTASSRAAYLPDGGAAPAVDLATQVASCPPGEFDGLPVVFEPVDLPDLGVPAAAQALVISFPASPDEPPLRSQGAYVAVDDVLLETTLEVPEGPQDVALADLAALAADRLRAARG